MSILTRVAWSAAKVFGLSGVIEHRVRATTASMTGRVMADTSLWQQFQRIGGALTPSQVSTIIREADTGHMHRLMDLANEARQKDGHLQAILSQSEEAIAGLDWQLRLPEGARAKDKRAMMWVEETLRACPDFRRMLAHQAGAVFYGRAVAETMWSKKDGKLVPATFVCQPVRRFAYRQEDGALVWRDPWMSNTGVEFQKEHPGKFIVSQPRVNGDAPCREGLVRPLVWASIFRNWTLTDWLRTAEMSWKPWRIGTYESISNTEDKEALEAALAQLTTNGWASIPKSVNLAIEWPSGTTSTKAQHSELFNVLAQEMSKAVLGQTETVQASTSSGYAQAKVHERVSATLIESRAKAISADITRDLVRVMIEWNFGKDYAVPTFELNTQNPVDLSAFATAIAALVSAGAEITQEWVQDQIGAPKPKPSDKLLSKPGLAKTNPADPQQPAQDGTKPPATPAPAADQQQQDQAPAKAA